MKRGIHTVWLRGACILSAILLGTSMGGAWQTASADRPVDESSGQTADMTGVIEAPLAVEPAVAPVVLTGKSVTHFRWNNYTFGQATSGNLVPLDATGRLQSDPVNFAGKLVVTYTAECAVNAAAGNFLTSLDIDIELVNIATGVITVLPPTNQTADAFCTSNGTLGFDGFSMNSITGISPNMPLADYVVQIRAKIKNGTSASGGWLGDTTLVIRK